MRVDYTAGRVFDWLTRREDWAGFGYLGERMRHRHEVNPTQLEEIERALVDVMPADDLFDWANSRDGRHFGDYVFGGMCGKSHRGDRSAGLDYVRAWRTDWHDRSKD